MNELTDWIAKEKRDLFCKSVNTQLINSARMKDKKERSKIYKLAQHQVLMAFKLFPDKVNEAEEVIDINEEIINLDEDIEKEFD